jgi:hypothetical protein
MKSYRKISDLSSPIASGLEKQFSRHPPFWPLWSPTIPPTWWSRRVCLSKPVGLFWSQHQAVIMRGLRGTGIADQVRTISEHSDAVCEQSWDSFLLCFLMRSAIFYAARRNNSSLCLIRRFPRPQDAGTCSTNTWHTCHPFNYYPGPTLLDFVDQIGTAVCSTYQDAVQMFFFRCSSTDTKIYSHLNFVLLNNDTLQSVQNHSTQVNHTPASYFVVLAVHWTFRFLSL